MNNTIPLPQIISQLAQLTDCDAATARKFLHEFFTLIESSLAAGETVKIKNIGTFSRSDNPAEPVHFTPDSELADGVNLPFAMFEAMPLADDISEDDLKKIEDVTAHNPEPELTTEVEANGTEDVQDEEQQPALETPQTEPQEPEQPTQEPEPTDEPVPEVPEVPEVADESEEQAPTATTDEPQSVIEEVNEPDEPIEEQDATDNEDVSDAEDYDDEPRKSSMVKHIIYCVLIFIAGAICGNIAHRYINFDNIIFGQESDNDTATVTPCDTDSLTTAIDSLIDKETQQADTVVTIAKDTAPQAKERPKRELVYDTITLERFLTTMARQYYGVMDYWVFIYEANANKLGHPNKIKPGTQVVIPPLDEYATEPTKAENLAKARRLAAEIYARY
jgi:nucleoid DNA-binding protein/nucleoid-associated protein YgaU